MFVRRILILATIASLLGAARVQAQSASVASSSGPVEILHGSSGKWSPLGSTRELRQQDLIRTGTGGGVRILFGDGSVAVLASASLLRLDELGPKDGRPRTLLRLLGGQVRATVDPGSGRFEIETPTAVATVRGTELIVTYKVDTAETEVICVKGSVEVVGVLGVLGKPVVLDAGMGTVVRKGAFPAAPAVVTADKLASLMQAEEGAVALEDGLLAGFTGAETAAVLHPPELPRQDVPARRQSLRTSHTIVSKDAEIIDQSIQEYTLTPPGQTPPGEVTVIIRP
jgi:hypothetical protein